MYPTEVVGDIWAEYPVVKVLAGVGVLTALVVYALRNRLTPQPQLATDPERPQRRVRRLRRADA